MGLAARFTTWVGREQHIHGNAPRGSKDTQLLVVLEREVELYEERVFEDGHQVSLSLHVLHLVLLYNMAFL